MVLEHVCVGAGEKQFAAEFASAGAKVDDVVGGVNGVGVVLHDENGIAQIARDLRMSMRRCVSRGCRPMEGSSRT